MKQISERNHYVPQFYLEYFCKPGSTGKAGFWVYYKNRPEPVFQTPINTAVELNLYTAKGPAGEKTDAVEKMVMTPIESASKPLIDYLLAEGDIRKPGVKENLAIFLSLLHVRVPRHLDAMRKLQEDMMYAFTKDLAERPDKLATDLPDMIAKGHIPAGTTVEELQEALRGAGTVYTISVNKQHATGNAIEQFKFICDELLKLSWSVCTAPDGIQFVTNDAPLNVFCPAEPGKAMFGAGFGLPWVDIRFPLSPKKCLFMSRRPRPPRFDTDGAAVIETNRRTCYMAERCVISSGQSRRIAKLVKTFSYTTSTPKIDGEDAGKRFLARLYQSEDEESAP